jgi:hypothetical protein
LAPHSPAEELTVRSVGDHDRDPATPMQNRLTPSPPGTDSRCHDEQGLRLSRTMLSNHKLPYVGRFACDWHRLATTDPDASHRIRCYARGARMFSPHRSTFRGELSTQSAHR